MVFGGREEVQFNENFSLLVSDMLPYWIGPTAVVQR